MVAGGRRGKDDRKQNIWAPLALGFLMLDSSFGAESQSKELTIEDPRVSSALSFIEFTSAQERCMS